ncbi:hypothetical protein H4219_002268 [Mycoemilia scoparia]|uniref:Glycosyl transferase family 25 domain-containing protein n=1 Tax=Mycoemilia scoparia TaxID=417184 RepID=A0A9W8A632_9FUNG|nr:hypothetical protein H4219_002268 [Mycoemilia scoparia]
MVAELNGSKILGLLKSKIAIGLIASGLCFFAFSSVYHASRPVRLSDPEFSQKWFFDMPHRKKAGSKLFTDNIYCISVSERIDHRARAQSLFDHLGLDVEYSQGVDLKKDRGYLDVPKDIWGKIEDKEVATWQSHVRVWKDMIKRGYELSLVLEDDVDFSMNIHEYVRKTIDIMEKYSADRSTSGDDPGWDIAYIGHCSNDEGAGKALEADFPMLRPATKPRCHFGYLLSKIGAQKLVDKMSASIDRSLDLKILDEMNNKNSLRVYSLETPVVVRREDNDPTPRDAKATMFRLSADDSTLDHVLRYGHLYTIEEAIEMGL